MATHRVALEAQLFGSIAVTAGGRVLQPRDFGGVKPKQLLEVLLLARGHPVSKDRLAEALWGDRLPRNVAGTLENYVSVLRRRLAPNGGGNALIVTERGAYRLGGEAADLDLDRFDDLAGRAARSATPAATALWAEAIALAARGELLEDEPYAPWAEQHRVTYRARVLDVLLAAAEGSLALGKFERAREYAQRAVTIDRFAERAYRAQALAAYALGRQHEALETYERVRSLLARELGLDPMPETRELQLAILRQVDARTLLPGVARSPEPSGATLPLLGRAAEVSQLAAALSDALAGRWSLFLVEGEAGVGKTRLIAEALAGLAGVRVGRATCCRLETRLAYVPLGTALREALAGVDLASAPPALRLLLPELGLEGDGRPAGPLEALEATVALVRAHAPVVLVLDDLQWADEHTIAALAYIRRRCRDVPGAIVAGVRVEDAHPDHPLRRLIPDASLRLDALSEDELDAHGIGHLFDDTGGHPAFVAAALSSPGGLVDVLAEPILAGCREEGPGVYSILLGAAVLDPPFSPSTLGNALALEPTGLTLELERLCERRLLVPDGSGFRFRHELVRRVLAASVSDARRELLLVE